jgi:hypothetical protein
LETQDGASSFNTLIGLTPTPLFSEITRQLQGQRSSLFTIQQLQFAEEDLVGIQQSQLEAQ